MPRPLRDCSGCDRCDPRCMRGEIDLGRPRPIPSLAYSHAPYIYDRDNLLDALTIDMMLSDGIGAAEAGLDVIGDDRG